MGENSEETIGIQATVDATLTPGMESTTSSSSATVTADDGVPNTELSGNVTGRRLDPNEKIPSSSSEPDPTGNKLVGLRPLYMAAQESTAEHAAQSASEMGLVQRSRKGHRKSRQGCFNCKRRKIKCQEARPACDNCIRRELVCRYPATRAAPASSHMQVYAESMGSPVVPVQLQTTPVFSPLDMRFFHHFIFHAYPHLPAGNDSIWSRRIPVVAYHQKYLMHAMLGQAASHLSVTTNVDYSSIALSHRLIAIKGLNEALSKTQRTGTEGDALLAACYCLTFQTANMKDGMSEFLTTVRGCGLVANQLVRDGTDISFAVTVNRHLEYMEPRLENLPPTDADLHKGAVASIAAIIPLCGEDQCLLTFQAILQSCLENLGVNPRLGYYTFYGIYQALGKMDPNQFSQFSAHNNHVSKLLLAHFVAIEIIMAPLLGREWKGRNIATPLEGTLQWLHGMRDGVPAYLRRYIDWPYGVATRIKKELRGELPQRPWLKEYFIGGLL